MKKTVIQRKMNIFFQDISHRLTILLIVLVFALPSNGQKIVPSPEDLYLEAGEYMLAGDYQEALPVLLSLREKGYSGANISYKTGECYLNMKGYKIKALPFLKEAVQSVSKSYTGNSLIEGNAPVKSLLYLGICHRLNYDFDNALKNFNAYLEALDENDIENRSLVRYHIDRCKNARELIASPARFSCDTMPGNVNTVYSNFNPLVTADEKQIFYMDQLKFYDAVMRGVKSDTTWRNSENLTAETGSDGDHLITGIAPDGTTLLMSSYDPYQSGEIFITEYKNGQWEKMRKLNGNINTQFNESHASLSPDGKYLYFISDRTGGYGGSDIYRSGRNAQGDWGVPENLGPIINSIYNEETPFVSGDAKTLFFSSQGHYNMGGYDIFMSATDGTGSWLPPVNLGYPLNTTDDDLFYFPLGSGKIAYESRYSPYSVQSDIVRYNIVSFGNPARYTLLGKVNLQADPDYEPGRISVSFTDNLSNDTISVRKPNKDGSFMQKLPAGSFTLDFAENDSVILSKKLDIPVYFPQDELVMNTDMILKHRGTRRDTLVLKDILFAYDKSRLEETYLQYLDKLVGLLSAYSGVGITLNGFADAKGNEIYNKKLSLSRANVVAEYFKNNNIFSGKIKVNGFGEQNPVAINQNPDGTDNPRGRSYNRRVELVLDHLPDGLRINTLNTIPEDLRIR